MSCLLLREKYDVPLMGHFLKRTRHLSRVFASQLSPSESHLKVWTGFCWRSHVRICSSHMQNIFEDGDRYLSENICGSMPPGPPCEHIVWRTLWACYDSSVSLQWIGKCGRPFPCKMLGLPIMLINHGNFKARSCYLPVPIMGYSVLFSEYVPFNMLIALLS